MRWWSILFTFILCGPAFGQPIAIRSGDHDGFSRLVLDVPAGSTWKFEQEEKSAFISIDGHNAGYDISTVFDRIDRRFIVAVQEFGSGISIEFACDCEAKAFTQGDSMIVIDVSRVVQELTSIASRSQEFAFVGQQELRLYSESTPIKAEPSISMFNDDVLDFELKRTIGKQKNPENIMLQPNILSRPNSDVFRENSLQEKLINEISIALSRGALSLNNPTLSHYKYKNQIQTNERGLNPLLAESRPSSDSELPVVNMRVTNFRDSFQNPGQPDSVLGIHSMKCIDSKLVSVQSWGNNENLLKKFGGLRAQLFDDLNRVDPASAIQFVKNYLFLGFGAEAKELLSLDEDLFRSYPELFTIAEIMEYGYSPNSQYLQHFTDCESDLALWSILSLPAIDPSKAVNVQAALLSSSGLPVHLRSFIAPMLSQRLLAYGDERAANAALRGLERVEYTFRPDANFAKANIEIIRKETTLAQERLEAVATSNNEYSPKALIKLVESYLEDDEYLDEGIATLVQAYAMELRDSPIGNSLQRAHVLALAKSGQFSEAFDVLVREQARSVSTEGDSTRSSILDLLTSNASDVDFLNYALTQINISPTKISPQTKFYIAERLSLLGFPEYAETILKTGAQHTDPSYNALLKAKIYLALDRPYESLAHLYSNNSPEALAVKAQAELSIGNFSKAHEMFTTIGDDIKMREAAWLSNDWERLAGDVPQDLSRIVRTAQSSLNTTIDLDGLLGRTEISIAESEEARRVIADVLNEDF